MPPPLMPAVHYYSIRHKRVLRDAACKRRGVQGMLLSSAQPDRVRPPAHPQVLGSRERATAHEATLSPSPQ